jgi:hypothetical protein
MFSIGASIDHAGLRDSIHCFCFQKELIATGMRACIAGHVAGSALLSAEVLPSPLVVFTEERLKTPRS